MLKLRQKSKVKLVYNPCKIPDLSISDPIDSVTLLVLYMFHYSIAVYFFSAYSHQYECLESWELSVPVSTLCG